MITNSKKKGSKRISNTKNKVTFIVFYGFIVYTCKKTTLKSENQESKRLFFNDIAKNRKSSNLVVR